jgi:hypothetical protein
MSSEIPFQASFFDERLKDTGCRPSSRRNLNWMKTGDLIIALHLLRNIVALMDVEPI